MGYWGILLKRNWCPLIVVQTLNCFPVILNKLNFTKYPFSRDPFQVVAWQYSVPRLASRTYYKCNKEIFKNYWNLRRAALHLAFSERYFFVGLVPVQVPLIDVVNCCVLMHLIECLFPPKIASTCSASSSIFSELMRIIFAPTQDIWWCNNFCGTFVMNWHLLHPNVLFSALFGFPRGHRARLSPLQWKKERFSKAIKQPET